MGYYVQRKRNDSWVSDDFEFDSMLEANRYANKLEVGPDPFIFRIVDDQSVVHAWVPRNGYVVPAVLPPKLRS